MPRISTDNYDTVANWNGSQDLFIVEQPDGTKVATPAMVKQFMEAGDFEATGEVKDGHGNILKNMAKSADVAAEIGDLSETGLTGDSVAEQLGTVEDLISGLRTATPIWQGSATVVDNIYNMTGNYTDYKYLLVTGKTNVEEKNILIPTSRISANTIFSDVLSAGAWNASTNAFTYNSCYGIKFTAANKFQLTSLIYNNSNWIFKPVAIYGIG